MTNNKSKIIVLYRVLQSWRAPIFERLSHKYKLEIWHGPDFVNSKLISSKNSYGLKTRILMSISLNLKSSNGRIMMPISPFVFFSLIRHSPDVVIAEGASNLFNSFMGFLYCKLFNKKFIWWSLGKLAERKYDNKRLMIDFAIRYIERKADRILTYSSVGVEYFKAIGVSPSKIVRAVNVVDTNETFTKHEKLKSSPDYINNRSLVRSNFDLVLLFCGALEVSKRLEVLLNVMSIKFPFSVKLLIIGDGPLRSFYDTYCLENDIKNVHFLGYMNEGKEIYFDACDLVVLPGLGGLVISEAMCYGKPVLVGIGDGCEVDLVTPNNGYILPNMTSHDIIKILYTLYEEKSLIATKGDSSLRIIKEKYNVETYLNNIIYAIDF